MAIKSLSFAVDAGEIRGLIGPNGAGKTTVFNLIGGLYRPTTGRIIHRGQDIAGMRTSQIARRGIVRTFQHATSFERLTVLENVLVGGYLHSRSGVMASLFGLDFHLRSEYSDNARELLDFFGMADRADDLAHSLPHGLQRTLGIAVAVASAPKILMLDEPFLGMNPKETLNLMTLVRHLREQGITILLVEHDMKAVMGLCDQITVINFGELLTEGNPADVRAHPAVIEAYLGYEATAEM